jgi:23S rRNA (uridine2552-2'-O)-methyltransferase
MTPKPGSPGSRDLKVRLSGGKGRSAASKRWLTRQLNDPYVARARREGYRSRAAFKLQEIDDKHRLFKRGAKVVDLGAAPGGWSQVAAERVGAVSGAAGGERDGGAGGRGAASGRNGGRVVAIDVLDMPAIPDVTFLQLDFLDAAAPERLKALIGGPADVVMSDMAANATGHRKTDHLKIMALAEAAVLFARDVLRPGGAFLCKVLQGGTEGELLAGLKRDFASVKHVKPAASRADSAELYVLATGFRGTAR